MLYGEIILEKSYGMSNQKNILIIEDDRTMLDIYTRVLKKKLNVVPCNNITEYEAALAVMDFDIFMIDLSLGSKKDGIYLIKELRKNEKYETTPIVVVTAYALHSDETAAIEAGATKFLRKPIENNSLLIAIMELLSKEF